VQLISLIPKKSPKAALKLCQYFYESFDLCRKDEDTYASAENDNGKRRVRKEPRDPR